MTALTRLSDAYLARYPILAARALEGFDATEVAAVLAEQEPEPAAAVLRAMAPALAAGALAVMEPAAAARVAAAMSPPLAVALLRRVSSERRDAIVAAGPARVSRAWHPLLSRPAGSAGALMDPQALWLHADLTIAAALAAVREHEARLPPYLYLIDRAGRLAGVADLIDLITAPETEPLSRSMHAKVERLHIDDPAEAVLANPAWRELRALPVVGADELLVGVVARDVVRQVLEEGRGEPARPLSLTLSLAELFWIGMSGTLDGFARAAARTAADEDPRG